MVTFQANHGVSMMLFNENIQSFSKDNIMHRVGIMHESCIICPGLQVWFKVPLLSKLVL